MNGINFDNQQTNEAQADETNQDRQDNSGGKAMKLADNF
jgi:hypothetical protein